MNHQLLTGSLTDNINSQLTHFVYYMCYILYPYNKVSQRKENIIKKIISLSARFFKLLQISKNFSNIFIENNMHVCGLMQFKPVLFKDQLHIKLTKPSLKFEEQLFSVFLDLGNRSNNCCYYGQLANNVINSNNFYEI